jgi:hypothetical protein
VTPRILAVLRLMTVSNLVACSIGMSPALLPLRIFRSEGQSPQSQDTLGQCGGDDASAPLLVLIGINLAPAEFKQGDVVTQREIPMAKHILMLTTVTFALVYGGIPARAQEDSDDPAITRHWEEVQRNQGDEEDTGKMGQGSYCLNAVSTATNIHARCILDTRDASQFGVPVIRLLTTELPFK